MNTYYSTCILYLFLSLILNALALQSKDICECKFVVISNTPNGKYIGIIMTLTMATLVPAGDQSIWHPGGWSPWLILSQPLTFCTSLNEICFLSEWTSLCMTDSRFTHTTTNDSASFLLMAEYYSITHMDHIFLIIHQSLDIQMWSQILAMNSQL